jgi:hypothetical protein
VWVKVDWSFLKLVGLVFLAVAIFVVVPLSIFTNGEIVRSVVAGGLASLFHLILGYLFVEYGFEKSNTTFLKVILGGTLVRMFLLVGIVLLLVRVYQFQAVSLMVSLLLFYVMNLLLEIHLLQKKVALKR